MTEQERLREQENKIFRAEHRRLYDETARLEARMRTLEERLCQLAVAVDRDGLAAEWAKGGTDHWAPIPVAETVGPPQMTLITVPHVLEILNRFFFDPKRTRNTDPVHYDDLARFIVDQLGTTYVKSSTHIVADPMPPAFHEALVFMRDLRRGIAAQHKFDGSAEGMRLRVETDALDWCLHNVEPPKQPGILGQDSPKAPKCCTWCGKPLGEAWSGIAYAAFCTESCETALKRRLTDHEQAPNPAEPPKNPLAGQRFA